MRRSTLVLVAAVCLLVLRPRPALAQSPAQGEDPIDRYLGRPIAAVHFEIDGKADTSPTLAGLVDVKVGDPLKVTDIRSSVQRLESAATFDEGISVVATDEGAGVGLTFRVSARHPVDRLEFQQDTGLDPKELLRRVKDQYGGLPTNIAPGKVAESVREILNDEGYLNADVKYTIVKRSNPDRSTLVFDVAAGDRATITEVILNNRAPGIISNDELRRRTGIASGQPFRLGDINRAMAAIRDNLESRRYFAAVVSVEPVVSPDQKSVVVTLTVDPGPRVEVRWLGDPRPAGNVDDLVPIERERAVDDDLLDDSVTRIQNALKAEGFLEADVKLAKDTSTPDVLIVTFTITRGPRSRVNRVVIPDDLHMTTTTLETLLGVKAGDVFNPSRIDTGLRAILSEYRRRGFYKIAADTQRQTTDKVVDGGDVLVDVQLRIIEGPQGFVKGIRFDRDTTHIPEATLSQQMRSKVGEPYVAGLAAADQDAISSLYLDKGFRTASVGIRPDFADEGRSVTLVVDINEGPQIIVADIQVIGNQRISDQTVIQAMTLKPGVPFGEAARLESQQRIAALGLFRRVVVDEAPPLPGETKAHVIVTVEEAPARTVSYGVGVDAGRLQRSTPEGGSEEFIAVSPRAFFAIQRRNLWGRNSSIDFFSRVSLKPTSDPSDPTKDGHGYGFTEYHVSTSYREPNLFGSKADLVISGVAEQGLRPTFNFLHKGGSAELLRRLTPRLTASVRYVLDFTRVFDSRIPVDQQLAVDRYFPQVRLSLVSTSLAYDRRNDPIAPSRGIFATADFETAGRAIGSEIGYVKTFLQTSLFRSLTNSRRFILATRAEVGLAYAFDRQAPVTDANGNPIIGPDGQPLTQTVNDLPVSQRFFAGGSSSVRGFALDQLGVPEVLDTSGLSQGGNGVVVLNAELRTLVAKLFGRNFGIVTFTDAGNVFRYASDVTLSRIRGSAGFGVRYDSPIGPLRLDYGWKFSRVTFPDGSRERAWEFHFSIGEAF